MSFQNKARDIATQDTARCIYANRLAFNVLHSSYWQKMVRPINETPTGFKGPSYEKMCTTSMYKEVKHVEDYLKPIKDS